MRRTIHYITDFLCIFNVISRVLFSFVMERAVFGKKVTFTQRASEPRGSSDRFMPSRDALVANRNRNRLQGTGSFRNSSIYYDIFYAKIVNKKKYVNYLDRAFGVTDHNRPKPSSPCALYSSAQRDEHKRDYPAAWPCKPRRQSHLRSADSVLDLPSYGRSPYSDLIDWGKDNLLLAALCNKIYIWSWGSQSLLSCGVTPSNATCCKFDPVHGDTIAVGLSCGAIGTYNVETNKHIHRSFCNCFTYDVRRCSITAIEWSPTGQILISGCSNGNLVVWSKQLQNLIGVQSKCASAVWRMRISPDTRYVVVLHVHSRSFYVRLWPDLTIYYELETQAILKSIAWHPWRSSLLATGAASLAPDTAVLGLWDAAPCKMRTTHPVHTPFIVDAMLFSHRTGELVMSCWREEGWVYPEAEVGEPGSRLVVLSDPETVVDQLPDKSTLDRVRCMMFSPDGTKLATATSDEDLIIWHFLPDEPKWKGKTSCAHSNHATIPVALDELAYGKCLR